MEEVDNQNLWSFELGSQESMSVPMFIVITFQQRDRLDSQILSNDIFSRLPVVSAQCVFGTGKYPDNSSFLKFDDDDDYSQAYYQIEEAFRALKKVDILQPFKSYDNFKSSNVMADDIGYDLDVFDIKYQQNFTASQPIEVEFKIDGVVPNVINRYALVLANKLFCASSHGQRHFDLI